MQVQEERQRQFRVVLRLRNAARRLFGRVRQECENILTKGGSGIETFTARSHRWLRQLEPVRGSGEGA